MAFFLFIFLALKDWERPIIFAIALLSEPFDVERIVE